MSHSMSLVGAFCCGGGVVASFVLMAYRFLTTCPGRRLRWPIALDVFAIMFFVVVFWRLL